MELMSVPARLSATSMLFVTGDARPPFFSLVLSGIAKGPGRRLLFLTPRPSVLPAVPSPLGLPAGCIPSSRRRREPQLIAHL